MKLIDKKTRGFTIIEIMIVLAIAGLILAIVFIALPQLQRNSRDNARQNAAARIKSEMETYAANNQGTYPFKGTSGAGQTISDFQSRYVSSLTVKNPSTGNNYTVVGATNGTSNPAADEVMIYPGMSCSGETPSGTFVPFGAGNNTKQYALGIQLDRSNIYFCLDNG